MTDTKHAFRILDDVPAPNLWGRIEAGGPLPDDPKPARPVWKRVVPIAVAAAITAAIVFVLSSAFRADPPSTPAVPSVPTVGPVADVTLGAPQVLPIDTEGRILSAAQEAFGSLWTIEGQELQRRDKRTGAVQSTFPIAVQGGGEWGGEGVDIGAGRVWVAASDDAIVYSIDPATDDVTPFTLEGKAVTDLAIDAEGQVWASVSSQGEVEVVLLDPATGQATPETRFEAEWWEGLYPLDDTVWTLERKVQDSTVQGGTLVQVEPGTVSPVDIGGSFALPVSDGTVLWTPFFGDPKGMNLASGIARVDPATGDVLDRWRTDPLGYDIESGADGGIWFLAESGLQRLNPATGTVDVHAQVDGTPIFIAPVTDGVWVATYEGDLVFFPFKG
jgi:hypothetical protein